MRRLVVIALMALLPVPAIAAPNPPVSLAAGDVAFWSGPKIETSSGQTFDYELDVTERAYRLRIGVDHPQVGDVFGVSITAPGGGQASSFSVGPGIYSEEKIFESPKTGTWRVRVTAQDVTDSAFRVRAKLEARPPRLRPVNGKVLPNLQILPPHDASFLFPATNGAADEDPTGVDTAGREGCHPEEHAEDQAVRCLRFAFGVRNTGTGPMDLFHTGSDPLEHDLFQRVYRPDGSSIERPAGKAVFHKTHGHWHHAEAVGLQLFAVTDRDKGVLEPAGAKRSKGFAHRNELLRDWEGFYPILATTGFGLRPGWADIYEWDRPGNYVDFGLNPDGFYVLRMWADPVDGIVEMNERDNLGYTYFRVEGSSVEVIEAGRGRDPWDRCKIEVGLGGFPDPPPTKRPADCPRDTA